MANFFATVKRELKQNKQGVIGGGAVGFIAALLIKQEGVSTLMAAGETGLIDIIAPNLAPASIAVVKFYLAAVLVGMAIGYVVDKYTKFI